MTALPGLEPGREDGVFPTTAEGAATTPRPGRPRLLWLPLVVFAALAAVFFLQLERGGDPGSVPSVLIGHAAPQFSLPPLAAATVPGLSRADLDGHVTLVNVFASWCVPCREEHPVLTALAKDPRLRIVGINYKDTPENARRFLSEMGNPYAAIGVDPRGRSTIDWGVYGVPETFLVGPDGVIRAKVIGPLTAAAINDTLTPALEKVLPPA
jgi:cytochrome c biogenesis protein CcmG/thiol:disulfide interchange protein DsbE